MPFRGRVPGPPSDVQYFAVSDRAGFDVPKGDQNKPLGEDTVYAGI